MDVNILNPFIESLKSFLESTGVKNIKRSNLYKKNVMAIKQDVSSFVGIAGDIRGNIAVSMNSKTALNITSLFMEGMEFSDVDEVVRSTIAEISNIVAGNATIEISKNGYEVDVTTPITVSGRDINFQVSSLTTITLSLESSIGNIEIDIGIE